EAGAGISGANRIDRPRIGIPMRGLRARPRIPMGRARRARWRPDRRRWGRAVPAAIAAAEIIGRDPAIGAALFDKAPAAATMLDVDLFAAAQRIDDAIAGAGAGADIDIAGGDSR